SKDVAALRKRTSHWGALRPAAIDGPAGAWASLSDIEGFLISQLAGDWLATSLNRLNRTLDDPVMFRCFIPKALSNLAYTLGTLLSCGATLFHRDRNVAAGIDPAACTRFTCHLASPFLCWLVAFVRGVEALAQDARCECGPCGFAKANILCVF